jgi:hypothetical protein
MRRGNGDTAPMQEMPVARAAAMAEPFRLKRPPYGIGAAWRSARSEADGEDAEGKEGRSWRQRSLKLLPVLISIHDEKRAMRTSTSARDQYSIFMRSFLLSTVLNSKAYKPAFAGLKRRKARKTQAEHLNADQNPRFHATNYPTRR